MAMTQKHKEALARGRVEARAVKLYLEAIQARRPGRPVTAESQKARLEELRRRIRSEKDALRKLDLTQQRMDLEDALRASKSTLDRDSLERGFVRHALRYSDRKGISYSAWREAGVPASTLAKAGIKRTRRSST